MSGGWTTATVAVLAAAAVLAWPGEPRAALRPASLVLHTWARGGRARLHRRRWRFGAAAVADDSLVLIEAMATQVRAGAAPSVAWRLAHEVVGSGTHDGPDDGLAGARGPRGPGGPVGAGGPLSLGGPFSPGGPFSSGEPFGPGRPVAGTGNVAMRSLAAAWQVADETGAPLADVLDRLTDGLRQEADVEAEIEASLAAPRATSRLLGGLPLAGIAMGELIGAHPLAVLVGTTPGRVCAVGGLLLGLAGQLWSRYLVARVAAVV